jgi:hypothetical protein
MGRKLSEIPSMSLIFDSEEQSPRQQQPSAPDAVPVPDDLSQSAEMRGFLTIEVKLDDLTIRIPWFHHELLGLFRSGRGHGAYYVRQLKKKIKERLAIRGYALTGSEMNSVLIEYHPPVSNNANDSDKEQQEEQQQTLCQLIETDGDLCDALQSNAGYNCDTLILSLFTFK